MPITNLDADGNPIMFDGTTATASAIIEPEEASIYIKRIYWLQPTTAGHLLKLETGNAREIITMRCEANNQSQWAEIEAYFPDIYCSDLDSGKVYIFTN